MRINKKVKIVVIGVLTIYMIIYVTSQIIGKRVDVSNYKISSKKIPEAFDNYKIVQLSDFHSTGYKNTTDVIINKIKKIEPDIIVMTGDMISWEVKNIEEIKKLIINLVDVAPIYYIDGNHEHLAEILRQGEYKYFIQWMKELGVTTIKNDYVEIYKDGESINLYGINLPLDEATGLYVNRWQLEKNYVEMTMPKVDKEKFNILLAHTPVFIKQYSNWGADLVLSGHMHGGIVRIPFTTIGILSPGRGLFPRYDAGKFKIKDTYMIVNRGGGTSSFNLRLFNDPEISVIKLKKKYDVFNSIMGNLTYR